MYPLQILSKKYEPSGDFGNALNCPPPLDFQPFASMNSSFKPISFFSISQAEKLLRGGLSVNSTWDTESTRNTPLHWAATFGTPEVVRVLVEHWGADVNAVNASGETPLHESVNRGQVEISDFLLKNGADYNVRAKQG